MFRKFIITVIFSLSIFALCAVPSFASTMSDKEMAIEQIRLCWQTSTSKKNVVSFDSLTSLCADLNRDGYPCEIRFVSALNGYAIFGTGYVHNTYESSRVYSLSGKYYSNIEGSIFYTPYQSDSLLSGISTYVSSISSQLSTVTDRLSTLISNVTTIHSDLESIDLLLSSCAQSLSNLNNYFNGDFRDYFFDIKNDVASSDTFLGQINSKFDTVITKMTNGGGTVDFSPIISRLDSLISRLNYPEYSPDSLRWYTQGSYSSADVSNIGYDSLTALSSLAISNNANIEVFDGVNIFTVERIHSVDLVEETINGYTGYFLRAFGSFFRSVNAVNEYHGCYLYLGPAGDGNLFYASDTSSVSLDTSGLENALSNINDNIIHLFGEYDSTYEFPLIPTSFSYNVNVSGAKSSLFASVSDSPDLYYCSKPLLRFFSFSGHPYGDSPLGSSYISKPDGLNAFTYFEDLSSNPVPSGTVLHRYFYLRYYNGFSVEFLNVPFTVSVSGDSCYIDGTIAPKWDSSGSWLGWYLNDSIIISDSEPDFHILSSPPASGDYFIYSTSSSPVPVVYSTRFTGFLQSQVVLLQNAIGSIGGSDLTGVTTRLDSILGKLDSSSGSDLTNIESALSTIIDKMDNLPASVDNIVVNITEDNSAYNIFYVEDENGDKKSVTSVAGDSMSASGKLLQFLYKLIIGSAISDVDNSIGGLNDFFFDNAPSGLGEGVTVWD